MTSRGTTMTQTTDESRDWTNWVGNQSFRCARQFAPAHETEIVAAVQDARRSGARIRCVGAGHSFTPIVETSDTLIDFSRMRGVTDVDADRRRVSALPGTLISEFGEPLWEAGLALHNQGDIDTQTIAGVVATGTHGSGLAQRSFSGAVRRVRLVTGQGEVLDVDDQQPELLGAAQVALGLLGVMTELELDVVPAYLLAERIEYLDYQDLIASWPEAIRRHRHFSCFWMPSDDSAELYGLEVPSGASMTDCCYVKIYDEVVPDADDRVIITTPNAWTARIGSIHRPSSRTSTNSSTWCRRNGRSRPLGRYGTSLGIASLSASFRWNCERPQQTTASCRPTSSETVGSSRFRELREPTTGHSCVQSTRRCEPFAARPHWGKLHLMTRERLEELFPRFDRFVEFRRELDPDGVFLNDHLRELFE